MAMEKYGVDEENLPATDSQVRKLIELYGKNVPTNCVSSMKAAQEAIDNFEKQS